MIRFRVTDFIDNFAAGPPKLDYLALYPVYD